MGARLLANKPFANGKRNRANTVSRQKVQGACLKTQKSHFSLLVRAHKGMNIHCPIFSAVCFIYLFKWFLSLCLSNPLLRFSLFFPLVAQKRNWSPKAADVFSTTKSRIRCTEQRRAKKGVWLWSKKLFSAEFLPNPLRDVTIPPFSQLELPSVTKWIVFYASFSIKMHQHWQLYFTARFY